MAGRNKRKSADYFSHDSDASSDEKIVYLESIFGHKGYAVYFKFLERMARSNNFEIEWNEIKKAIYASEFNISVTEIEQIVTECCRKEIKAFQINNGKMFSTGLKKRMQPLLDKREYNRLKYEEKKLSSISVTEIDNSATEMIQSKVKESKVKNIYTAIFTFWNAKEIIKHRTLDPKTKTAINNSLKVYTENEITKAISNYSAILQSDKYYFTYKWTLLDFLGRGLRKFVDEAVPFDNYFDKELNKGIDIDYENMQ